MSQAMIWVMVLSVLFGSRAHSADAPDPQGLLKAILFPYEAKVEEITGVPSCEDELTRMINDLGRMFAENSSDKRMGAIAEEAYNDERSKYLEERLMSVDLSYDDRVDRLKKMVPRPEPFRPARSATPESGRADFIFYLTTELSKLEKSAIVKRALRDLEDAVEPLREVRPLEVYYLGGNKGRAFRLILFLRDKLPQLEVDYEEAFKAFVDAFLTEEIIKESLGVHQYQNTQGLFLWLSERNPVLYFYFLDKYQPFTTEKFLLGIPE